MMNIKQVSCLIILGFCMVGQLARAVGVQTDSTLYFVDAHSQIDDEVDDMDIVLRQMDKANVYKTILAARGKRNWRDVAEFAAQNSKRIIASVRSKSGKYKKNHPKFYRMVDKQVEDGRFEAMAEVLMYHAQKGDVAPEVSILTDDERVTFLLDHAKENGWPFVPHIEFASLSGSKRTQFMKGLEELLRSNPNHPFALTHIGQLNAVQVRALIKAHDNIHFILSHANPVTTSSSSQPWENIFSSYEFRTEWKKLFVDFPKRFIFAIDNVWADHWNEDYQNVMEYWHKAMKGLPKNVAHAIAHKNAERLWRLEPKP